MSVKQISVFLENKPGALMGMTDLLAANKIDMRALSLAETSDFGIARIIVDDVYAASDALKEDRTQSAKSCSAWGFAPTPIFTRGNS